MSPGGDEGARLRRLRWRSRRGLLENDLVLTRFFARFGEALSEEDIRGMDFLLDLPDNELLDLIIGRIEPEQSMPEQGRRVLAMLRSV